MDAQIKKRMNQDITVFPCIGSSDGDKQFGDPIVLKGYCIPKYVVITTREGVQVQCNSSIIMSEENQDKVKDSDEVETSFISRRPIRAVLPYSSLKVGWELIEVLI